MQDRARNEAVPRALGFGTDVGEERALADGVADVRDGDAIEPALRAVQQFTDRHPRQRNPFGRARSNSPALPG
jgi:hypothetical protein